MNKNKIIIGFVIFFIFTVGILGASIALAGQSSTSSEPDSPLSAESVDFEVEIVEESTALVDLGWMNVTTTVIEQPIVEHVHSQVVGSNYAEGDGSRWDQLAQCEAGGNWATNTGNGFGGGLQFMHQKSYSTWLSFGGGEFAPHPWEASRESQIVIAEKVLASSGWNAWPGCSRKFGWL